MAQGIFISYRRDTGSTMARMIYDRLRLEKKYQCFLDVETLNAGNFRDNITLEMDKCDIFLLVLTRNALNRCSNQNDNVRQEIEAALKKELAIIPIMGEDFVWPETMPAGLESIQNFNAIPYVQVYSEQFFERLYSFIDTVRTEEKVKKNAIRSSKIKENAGNISKASASSISDSGRSAAKGANGASKKGFRLPIIIVGGAAAVAVIVLAVTMPGRGNKSSAPPVSSIAAEDTAPESAVEQESVVEPGSIAEQEDIAGQESIAEQESTAGQKRAAETAQNTLSVFSEGENIIGGTNQLDAITIPIDTKITGTASDGKTWWYTFQTGTDTEYTLNVINKSAEQYKSIEKYVRVMLCDKNGEEIDGAYVSGAGFVTSKRLSLSQNTTYYLKINSNGNNSTGFYPKETAIDYALMINDSAESSRTVWGNGHNSTPGTNQDNALMIALNTAVSGTASDGLIWFYSFTTGPEENAEYIFSAVNKSGQKYIHAEVYDCEGNKINGLSADSTGSIASFQTTLSPAAIYYLAVYCNGDKTGFYPKSTPLDYTVTVKTSE